MSSVKKPFKTSRGAPVPLGPTASTQGVNFSVFSRNSRRARLVFNISDDQTAPEKDFEIILDPAINKTGDIWHIFLHSGNTRIAYGYILEGEDNPTEGIIFYADRVLIDPYATQMLPRAWGAESSYGTKPVCVAGPEKPFDWLGDRPLKTPLRDTIIYELHVRGFTNHHSASVQSPGTFSGIIEKIPYLKQLGVTAIELLPVTEWDETDNRYYNPETGTLLLNYWGYNPISFFSLKNGLASSPHDCLNEFKLMVRSLHQAGIEVILDMVFNHTGEIGYDGNTTCFRGIDNPIYYMLDKTNGEYHNFSGCGNTLNCNHPVVRNLILDSLHYWVNEMHIDGFRFDLAAIFSRDTNGHVDKKPPLVEMIAEDPLLRDTKIIAEAWDASGLYQVGSFSEDERWLEWNGRYRDDVRMFMSGRDGTTQTLATRIAGSSDLYQKNNQGPLNSINFLSCHDGFTLYDMVSYNEKANHANGEKNQDGDNHNLSWNSGCEGDQCSPEIETFRQRRIRTFTAILLLSQGVPMFGAGDEFGRSQSGNNNSWCQDNEIGWIDWNLAHKNRALHRFFLKCIELRKTHQIFRRTEFFKAVPPEDPQKEISWQSLIPGEQDWSQNCHTLAFLLHNTETKPENSNHFFIMVNGARNSEANFIIPDIPATLNHSVWRMIIDTAAHSPEDITDFKKAEEIQPQSRKLILPMGLVVLQSGNGKPEA